MLECPPNQELIRPSLHIPCEITDGKPNGRMSACQIRAVCTVQMCLNFASARLKIARLAPDRNWFEASCAGRRVAPSAVPSDVSRCQFRFYNNTTMPPFFFYIVSNCQTSVFYVISLNILSGVGLCLWMPQQHVIISTQSAKNYVSLMQQSWALSAFLNFFNY